MPGSRHILVIRLSAMGDVAMTVPVITALIEQNPELHVTYVSRPEFTAFFAGIPRLHFLAADLKYEHKGLSGIISLFRSLKKTHQFDAVADLHDTLRSKILRKLFILSGVRSKHIDKGRAEKKKLTRYPDKVLTPLKLTTERYADVFRQLGYDLTLSHRLQKKLFVENNAVFELTGSKTKPWIGIAPFAKHKGKIFPLDKTEEIIAYFSNTNVTIFLFGGSLLEMEICKRWELKYPNTISLVQRLKMDEELLLIRQLDVMMSMDSAAMHLASMEGIPVVSVWGATHYYAGFLGYGQSPVNTVSYDIECRPCSVYGNKPCFRKDYACLNNIAPKQIITEMAKFIEQLPAY